MDVLIKGLGQLGERFRLLTPGARLAAAALVVLVVVSLGYLFQSKIAGGETYLLGAQSFSSSDLPAMEAAFAKGGLSGYRIEAGRIRIPSGQQAAYMGALADAGALPANFNHFLDEALKGGSPWDPPKQREERLKLAKQQELALIIRSMHGIEKAAVHYDAKKASAFAQESLVTASVSVKPTGSQPLNPKQVPMIRDLVAGAIAGLLAERVTVVDLNGRTYTGSTRTDLAAVSNDRYVEKMIEYQGIYETRIASALSYVRGVSVTVNVELNKELRRVENENIIDPKNASVERTRQDTTTTRTEPLGSGNQPKLLSADDNASRTASAGGISTEERQTNEVQNIVGSKQTQVHLAALTPKRVTVAVGVPSSYFAEVWRQRNPAVAGRPQRQVEAAELAQIERDEKDKIRAHVTGILPPPAEPVDHAAPLVTVTTFQSFAPEAIPEPTSGEQILSWLGQSWSTLGMFGLAIVGMVLLRSVARSTTAATSNPPAHTPSDLLQTSSEPSTAPSRRPERIIHAAEGVPSPHVELAGMVRENPRAAADVLRAWIGNAS